MRKVPLIIAAFLLLVAVPVAAMPIARAQAVPTPTLSLFVFGETNGTKQVFVPDQIIVPQVPIHLLVTFHNNDKTNLTHSFSMNDENGTRWIDTGILSPEQNATVEFTIVTMTQIMLANGTRITPEPGTTATGTSGILFYCIPHRGQGVVGQDMVGLILLGGATSGAAPEKGILLRAYWIGIIGIAATLLWTVITYFVIKTSSRHFVDHSEHVRKGLP